MSAFCTSPAQHTCTIPPPPLSPPPVPSSPPPCNGVGIVASTGSCVADPNALAASVGVGANGKLVYTPSSAGDSIPDFAHVGYGDDLVALPSTSALPALQAVSTDARIDDDSPRIQAAINAAASAPLDASTGFRGVVELGAGVFRVGTPLVIGASGIVLRGAGDASGGTQLVATSATQHTILSVEGADDVAYDSAEPSVAVTDAYVPVGARRLSVGGSSASRFAAGDLVVVSRHSNSAWIGAIGMDTIDDCTGSACSQWDAADYTLRFERTITRVESGTLHLDAPLVESIETRWGGGSVRKASERRISHVGVEHLTFNSTFDASLVSSSGGFNLGVHYTDEAHAWTALSFEHTMQSWARHVTCFHLGYSCVHMKKTSKQITVSNCASLAPVSSATGGRRYAFNVEGQRCLVKHCHSDLARHAYITGSRAAGPNVFYRSTSARDQSDIGPHHRWGVGQLYDNVQGGQMRAWDRGNWGSGHGWAGNQIVFWNCESLASFGGTSGFVVQSPYGGSNYCIGCVSDQPPGGAFERYDASSPRCCGKGGVYSSSGTRRSDIESLYDMQLAERLFCQESSVSPFVLVTLSCGVSTSVLVVPVVGQLLPARHPLWRVAVLGLGGAAFSLSAVIASGIGDTCRQRELRWRLALVNAAIALVSLYLVLARNLMPLYGMSTARVAQAPDSASLPTPRAVAFQHSAPSAACGKCMSPMSKVESIKPSGSSPTVALTSDAESMMVEEVDDD